MTKAVRWVVSLCALGIMSGCQGNESSVPEKAPGAGKTASSRGGKVRNGRMVFADKNAARALLEELTGQPEEALDRWEEERATTPGDGITALPPSPTARASIR